MIYVMRSAAFDKNGDLTTLIKIGYTGEDSRKSRFNCYLTENPTIKILYLVPGGTENDERSLHFYFRDLLVEGREWFKDDYKIIEFFNTHKTTDSLKDIYRSNSFTRSERLIINTNKNNHKDWVPIINIVVSEVVNSDSTVSEIKYLEDKLWLCDDIFDDSVINYPGYSIITKYNDYIKSISNLDAYNGNIFDNLMYKFNNIYSNFIDRMKLLCDTYFSHQEFFTTNFLKYPLMYSIPYRYFNYINTIGFERIKALKYCEGDIIKYIESQNNLNKCNLSDIFNIGDKYSKKDLKDIIGKFYQDNNIIKTPKASDLEEYFELKACKVKNLDGKWENGFEIIGVKQ